MKVVVRTKTVKASRDSICLTHVALTPATGADKHDIWVWRNDPETVAASTSGGEIPWALHSDWFERKLSDRRSAIYIGELDNDGEKVGMCRFDINSSGDSAEVSINLNPSQRGKRHSSPLLRDSILAFRRELGAHMQLTATIRVDNPASRRLFSSAGFTLQGIDGDLEKYVSDLAE